MCCAFKKEVNGGHESHDPVETGSSLIFLSVWSDAHLALQSFQIVHVVGNLAQPQEQPQRHKFDWTSWRHISATTPSNHGRSTHRHLCLLCHVPILTQLCFFFLDSASATGGSPISPWQERLHLARAQANASLCCWAAKVCHLCLCLFLRLTWLCTHAACVYLWTFHTLARGTFVVYFKNNCNVFKYMK